MSQPRDLDQLLTNFRNRVEQDSKTKNQKTKQSYRSKCLVDNPDCNDGWIVNKETNSAKRCQCYKIEQAKRMIRNSEVGDSIEQYGFKDFETEGLHISIGAAKKKALEYYKHYEDIRSERHNSICFLSLAKFQNGQVKKHGIGSGKTHLLLALTNGFLNHKHIPLVYMSYVDTVKKIKQVTMESKEYYELVAKYQKAPILCIDDLFKAKSKDNITNADVNIMFEIINYRYVNNLPMIITSEFDADALVDIDDAVGSRIFQMCRDYICVMGSEKENTNYRLR